MDRPNRPPDAFGGRAIPVAVQDDVQKRAQRDCPICKKSGIQATGEAAISVAAFPFINKNRLCRFHQEWFANNQSKINIRKRQMAVHYAEQKAENAKLQREAQPRIRQPILDQQLNTTSEGSRPAPAAGLRSSIAKFPPRPSPLSLGTLRRPTVLETDVPIRFARQPPSSIAHNEKSGPALRNNYNTKSVGPGNISGSRVSRILPEFEPRTSSVAGSSQSSRQHLSTLTEPHSPVSRSMISAIQPSRTEIAIDRNTLTLSSGSARLPTEERLAPVYRPPASNASSGSYMSSKTSGYRRSSNRR